ncbi:hypothetical protein DFP73DRAFT_370734 [Morchella snyderi]|nr:hypothetical protein DFP73DRAFT_370734 [Morchella snyderi]
MPPSSSSSSSSNARIYSSYFTTVPYQDWEIIRFLNHCCDSAAEAECRFDYNAALNAWAKNLRQYANTLPTSPESKRANQLLTAFQAKGQSSDKARARAHNRVMKRPQTANQISINRFGRNYGSLYSGHNLHVKNSKPDPPAATNKKARREGVYR